MKRAVLAVAMTLGACGHAQKPSDGSSDAIVYVRANVRDANVFVDGQFIGPLGVLRRGIVIEPGKHRVEVRRDDYFSRYIELDLKRAERRKLEITLAPVLP